MENVLYTYALIKSLFDIGEDYIDSFLPLVLRTLEGETIGDSAFIQANLIEIYKMEMPIHVVGTVLSRARKRKLTEQVDKNYRLTEKGAKYLEGLETEKEVDRRINALLDDLLVFFKQQKQPINRNQIFDSLVSFIDLNVLPLIEWLNPDAATTLQVSPLRGEQYIIADYLREAEQRKPDEFHTLQDLIFGSIISTILYTESSTDMVDLTRKRFGNCRIFLDTNLLFCLLDLESRIERSQPAKELFELLKDCKFNVRVFDFTTDELAAVLGWYVEESYRYPTTIKVDGVCAKLKREGWTSSQVIEFIANLDDTLNKLGIAVQRVPGINIRTYDPRDKKLRDVIRRYKPGQRTMGQNHDLAAIEKIQDYRGHSVKQVESCKALFLTMDGRLSRFDFIEMGHKDRRTIAEVMQDRLLTNILWLKNPKTNLPLTSIIAAHSRHLFISRKVWNRFYDELAKLRQEGKVQDENISTLFYHDYVEDSLRQFVDGEEGWITPQFVLAEIEKSTNIWKEEANRLVQAKEEIEKAAKEKEETFAQQLTRISLEREQEKEEQREKEKERLERLRQTKNRVKMNAQRAAKLRIFSIRVLLALIFIVPAIVFLTTKNWAALGATGSTFSCLALVFGVVAGSVPIWWRKLEDSWLHSIYNKKIKEIGLDGLQ